MRKSSLILGVLLVLSLFLAFTAVKCAKVDLEWDSEGGVSISILVHKRWVSSTSGWVTEASSILEHEAESSTGMLTADASDYTTIEGNLNALDGDLLIMSFVDQKYGAWFRGVRIASGYVSAPEIFAYFSSSTPAKTDNTWPLSIHTYFETKGDTIFGTLRDSEFFRTHGNDDPNDDELTSQFYAIFQGSGKDITGMFTNYFESTRGVWWGNETVEFDVLGMDIEALISTNYPEIELNIDIDSQVNQVFFEEVFGHIKYHGYTYR